MGGSPPSMEANSYRDAGGLEHGQGMGDFPQVEPGGLAAIALGAMAGQDEEDRLA